MTCGGDPNVIGIVVAGLTEVHTNNGTVTGCGTGILLSGGGSHHLNGLTATGNVCCGGGGTGDGIRLEASHDNHINGSSASLNHAVGVRMVGSDRNRLNMMVINSNEGPPTCGGVLLVNSDNNVVSSSDISDNGDFGVEAFPDPTTTGSRAAPSTGPISSAPRRLASSSSAAREPSSGGTARTGTALGSLSLARP